MRHFKIKNRVIRKSQQRNGKRQLELITWDIKKIKHDWEILDRYSHFEGTKRKTGEFRDKYDEGSKVRLDLIINGKGHLITNFAHAGCNKKLVIIKQ